MDVPLLLKSRIRTLYHWTQVQNAKIAAQTSVINLLGFRIGGMLTATLTAVEDGDKKH